MRESKHDSADEEGAVSSSDKSTDDTLSSDNELPEDELTRMRSKFRTAAIAIDKSRASEHNLFISCQRISWITPYIHDEASYKLAHLWLMVAKHSGQSLDPWFWETTKTGDLDWIPIFTERRDASSMSLSTLSSYTVMLRRWETPQHLHTTENQAESTWPRVAGVRELNTHYPSLMNCLKQWISEYTSNRDQVLSHMLIEAALPYPKQNWNEDLLYQRREPVQWQEARRYVYVILLTTMVRSAYYKAVHENYFKPRVNRKSRPALIVPDLSVGFQCMDTFMTTADLDRLTLDTINIWLNNCVYVGAQRGQPQAMVGPDRFRQMCDAWWYDEDRANNVPYRQKYSQGYGYNNPDHHEKDQGIAFRQKTKDDRADHQRNQQRTKTTRRKERLLQRRATQAKADAERIWDGRTAAEWFEFDSSYPEREWEKWIYKQYVKEWKKALNQKRKKKNKQLAKRRQQNQNR
jgi:hypothetical protein